MAKISLLGIDLDGTAFTEDKKITPETEEALKKAQRQGAEIVFSTGRPFHGIPPSVIRFPGTRYLVTSNGAMTLDLEQEKPLRGNFLDPAFAEKTIRLLSEEGVIYTVFIQGYGYVPEGQFDRLMDTYKETWLRTYMEKSRRPVKDVFSQMEESASQGFGIENIWMISEIPGKRDEIASAISSWSDAHLILSSTRALEIVSPKADKGTELLAIASHLHIPTDEVYAIGDSANDIGMLKAAGHSAAMGNATPQAKEAADFVTEDNSHNGAAAAIERFLED